ncbi:MAG: hypothetical protein Fues2KO_36430 [Fuerstiella sp.]
MPSTTAQSILTELRAAVRSNPADAYLVEPRVVRRIMRELHGFARLSTRIPHTDVIVVAPDDVRLLAHPDELGLESFQQLPAQLLLVAQPEEFELELHSREDLFRQIWARLFHGCIDLKLHQLLSDHQLSRAGIQAAIDRVGQVEFDEAHAVLKAELRLVNVESHVEAWCEFVAVYLQLLKFSPDLLPVWFPSLAGRTEVQTLLSEQVDFETVFRTSRLSGAPDPRSESATAQDEDRVARERRDWSDLGGRQPSARRHARLVRKRTRWSDRGNTVAAGVCAIKAAESATTSEDRELAIEAARNDVDALAIRLHEALQFDEADLELWRKSLWELLQNSTRGFWNSDKRLLYDLQKVCLDHERIIYQVDLVKWIVSRGRRPLRRPLRNLREVMMAKHLASSASRLVYVRLSGAERDQLSHLIHVAARLAETQMRERMRPAVQETIEDVGLKAHSVPEKVAFDKMVEESLDCITQRGYLTMGYLRDAISRNDLKLPDLTDPKDLIRGDHLLRTDDRLDVSLDGVYRRGEFYLRWLQVVSSLAFGTRTGRFATLFLVIPFGGAVVIVVGLHHLVGVLTGSAHHHEQQAAAEAESVTGALPDEESDDGSEVVEPVDLAATDRDERSIDDALGDVNETGAGEGTADNPTAVADTGADESDQPTAVADEPTDRPDDVPPSNRDAANPTVEAATETDVANEVEGSDASADDAEQQLSAAEAALREATEEPPKDPHPVYEWIGDQTVSLSIVVGFLLMALVHLPKFREGFWNLCRYLWRIIRTVVYDVPVRLLNLPAIRRFWRARWFVRLRRSIINPLLIAWIGARVLPALLSGQPLEWWLTVTIAILLSAAVNSRLGRDAEELASEWLANAWHDLRTRFLVALYEWTLDVFKWLLNTLERFIYAVDEWLRFHSGETWPTLVAKAFLGVIWSFVSFLIRIYVNLLIEPTLHPVKHFPVVTVAHKIFLPVIIVIEMNMRQTLTPYLGIALAGPITWFNIVFLPGIFGFLVWELKENWRLYASNRMPTLQPVIIGSHGETGGRLLKPGFHSGTLPKLFGRLRRLEQKEPSFHRFCERRALHERLEHTELDIRRFVERDLVRVLAYCPVWESYPLKCEHIHAASNSFLIELSCPEMGPEPLHILFQEQSHWLVATVSRHGWLQQAQPEQVHSFETALRGFYCKAGVELVREQMERQLIGSHPYDVSGQGLVIWPERQFDRQIICDLNRRHQIRPWPPGLAASYGLQPISRELIVYSESRFLWSDWKRVWAPPPDAEAPDGSDRLPLACLQSARVSVLRT